MIFLLIFTLIISSIYKDEAVWLSEQEMRNLELGELGKQGLLRLNQLKTSLRSMFLQFESY
jgi:hypothetical protein